MCDSVRLLFFFFFCGQVQVSKVKRIEMCVTVFAFLLTYLLVRYNLRAQTGGREAQERPMTAFIDNSRAGLAGA